MMNCKSCIHYDVCLALNRTTNICFCDAFKPSANFIELPIDVGQKVWYLQGGYENKYPCEVEVVEINKTTEWGFLTSDGVRRKLSNLGKTIFLSKEELCTN